MKITRDNYESFFLDYLEKNLPAELESELLDFLHQNPDLKDELQLFEDIVITAENLEFRHKERLYRKTAISSADFENMAIAYIENELNEIEKEGFLALMAENPELQKELKCFEATKLTPDISVKFDAKTRLYRQPVYRLWLYRTMQAAAVLLVAFAIWGLWPSGNNDLQNTVEVSTKQPEQQTVTIIPVPEKSSIAEVMETKEGSKTAEEISIKHTESTVQPVDPQVETLLAERELITIPELEPVREITITASEPENSLAIINDQIPEIKPDVASEPEYLTDKLKDKIGVDGLSLAKIVRAGLDLAGNVTNDKISYNTNQQGEIVALSVETRFIGIRMPVGKK